MANWTMTLEVWPYSQVASARFEKIVGNNSLLGAEHDQMMVGPRERRFHIVATDARDALRKAELIVQGIKSSELVWEAPIRSLEYVDDHA